MKLITLLTIIVIALSGCDSILNTPSIHQEYMTYTKQITDSYANGEISREKMEIMMHSLDKIYDSAVRRQAQQSHQLNNMFKKTPSNYNY